MRAFKQKLAAFFVDVVQGARHIGEHGQNARRHFFNHRHHIFQLHGLGLMQVLQLHIVISQIGFYLGFELVGVQQIHHADGAAGHFVFISRADAAAGGADFSGAARSFTRLVERHMVGQNHGAGGRDFQTAFHVFHAGGIQFINLAQQGFGAHHHAGADKAVECFMQNAARNQAQNGFFAAHHQRVAGIVAALKAHHAGGFFCQPVYNFTFAFIAPLSADYHYVFSHVWIPLKFKLTK